MDKRFWICGTVVSFTAMLLSLLIRRAAGAGYARSRTSTAMPATARATAWVLLAHALLGFAMTWIFSQGFPRSDIPCGRACGSALRWRWWRRAGLPAGLCGAAAAGVSSRGRPPWAPPACCCLACCWPGCSRDGTRCWICADALHAGLAATLPYPRSQAILRCHPCAISSRSPHDRSVSQCWWRLPDAVSPTRRRALRLRPMRRCRGHSRTAGRLPTCLPRLAPGKCHSPDHSHRHHRRRSFRPIPPSACRRWKKTPRRAWSRPGQLSRHRRHPPHRVRKIPATCCEATTPPSMQAISRPRRPHGRMVGRCRHRWRTRSPTPPRWN